MKRAVGTAILVGGGGCGGIIAANVFRQQDAPKYLPLHRHRRTSPHYRPRLKELLGVLSAEPQGRSW
jgi:hypothetical protein